MNQAGGSSPTLEERSRRAYGKHVVFYDGVCGLCNNAVQYVLRHDREKKFLFASLQSDFAAQILPRFGKNPADLDTVHVVRDFGTDRARVLSRSDAGLLLLSSGGFPRNLLAAFFVVPSFIRDSVYDIIAAYRYRWFGKHDSCLLPQPGERDRFIDV